MNSEWLTLIPLFLAMLVSIVGPGYFWVRASVRSSVVSAALAPAITLGLLTLLGQTYHLLGIPWNALTVMPVLLAVTAAGGVFWWTRREANPESSELFEIKPVPPLTADVPAAHAYRIMTRNQRRLWWCMIVVGWLLAALPTLMVALPSNPAQQWDAVFHINGVWHLTQTQDAGLTAALAPMYAGVEGTYYPAAWHITAALFATPTTATQVGHLMSLLIMVLWVMGAAALTSVVTTSRIAAVVAPVVSGLMLSMPSDSLTMYVQWPHALALSVLPGMIAAFIIWGRRLARSSEKNWKDALVHWPLGVFLLVGTVGMAHAHGSALFAFAWTVLIPCIGACMSIIRRPGRNRTVQKVAAGVTATAVVVIPLWLLNSPQLKGMGNYNRSGISWEYAITHALMPLPPLPENIDAFAAGITFAVLTLFGCIRLYTRARAWDSARAYALSAGPRKSSAGIAGSPEWERHVLGPAPALWLVGAYMMWTFATFVAYSPEDMIRTFWLSPWYMDPRRIMGVQNMVMIPLISYGFAAMVTWIRAHWPRQAEEGAGSSSQRRIAALLGIWLLVLSVLGAFDSRLYAARYVFDPDHLGKPGMLTQGELDMVKRIPETIPEGARILGDPIAGAAYVESIGQRQAFFPQLTTSYTGTDDATVFLEHFSEIHSNPAVCEALKAQGIEYVYLDADGKYYGFNRSERAPGLYGVDVSQGFELLDHGDNAALYRITACQ